MKHVSLRRALSAALVCAAAGALAPAAASASTWTVDDDKAQCPNAAFTTIQDAVDQAAPWDTIAVCAGTYAERSTPINHANSPSQAGAMNGLTITKPLTIRGAGADKVTILPAPSLGASLAGTVPYLRDGGGNVITVSRQSLGASDDNENFVEISGVTVTSPTAYAEAGIAFFNTSGRVVRSTVGPLLRAADGAELTARPHGWGIVQTNSLQGTEAGARREVSVVDSLVTGYQSGGVLFDEARGADGAASTTQRSGMVGYGYVTGTRVAGSGPSTLIPQTGVRYHAGARGAVSGSEIVGHSFTPDARQSVGILLTDAETGIDPSKPGTRAFDAVENTIAGNGYGIFNADIANAAVRNGAPARAARNWWRICSGSGNTAVYGPVVGASTAACDGISGADAGGAASVIGAPNPSAPATGPLTAAPAALVAPKPVVDAAPTAQFATEAFLVAPGAAIDPVVAAADDFGVASVALTVGGTTVTKAKGPYAFDGVWTATAADVGQTLPITAKVTDSAGAVTTIVSSVRVVDSAFLPLTASFGGWDAGAVTVGQTATRTVTVTNTTGTTLRLATMEISGDAFAATAPCGTGDVLRAGATCAVELAFTPAAAGAAGGELTIGTTAWKSALKVALSGTGVASATPAPAAPAPAAPAQPTPAPAPATPKPVAKATAKLASKPTYSATTGKITVGTATCPAGKACTVAVRATVTIAGRRYTITGSTKVAGGRTVTLRITPGKAARAALRRAKKGTLAVKVTLGGRTTTKTATIRA